MSDAPLKPSLKSMDVYAIVRYDRFHGADTPVESCIGVKKVVTDADYAEREVEQLNRPNGDKDSHYFPQLTRLQIAPLESSLTVTESALETAPIPQPH